ncbi:BLTX81-like protein [Leptotrombidium deliense]|uniref:BLTX81-like protein n=1 Tax=Leptotrombidium deliense TaxID=299467 RepID=A0A443SLX4_9ACAR|nr:BLTX81-like protein [Leptotrombidium deliense]
MRVSHCILILKRDFELYVEMEGLLSAVIDAKEAKKFEENYLRELEQGNIRSTTKFEYSWSLIAQKNIESVKKGIRLLEELCYTGDNEAKRDYLFYLAVANAKIGDYSRAMQCNDQFLSVEPNNYQALELQCEIKNKLKSEGLQGIAIVGGAVAVLAAGLGAAAVAVLHSLSMMEALLEECVSSEDLRKFERKYYEERDNGTVNNRTMFEYAWALIRSKFNAEVKKGIMLLEQLCYSGDDDAKRDYLFYLSVANTRIGDYPRALNCTRKFLAAEPNNRQAQDLEKIIKERMAKESLKGMAIVGGTAALVIGGLVGIGMALSKK